MLKGDFILITFHSDGFYNILSHLDINHGAKNKHRAIAKNTL